MTDPLIAYAARASLNRLCKWRSVFAGWQLGTRLRGDGESEAVRDHREVTMLLRAEVNALTKILLDAKIVNEDTLTRIVGEEAEYLSAAYEKKFPGAEPTDDGMTFDLAVWSTLAAMDSQMAEAHVTLVTPDRTSVIDESSIAYKDIELVMADSTDLVTSTMKLYPVGVVKG
jgi:hypothetical protein